MLKGQWADFDPGGGFRRVEGNPGQTFDFIADGVAKAQLQWLADRENIPQQVSARTYSVAFIGRIGHRDGVTLDGHSDVVVVDRVISARAVERYRTMNERP